MDLIKFKKFKVGSAPDESIDISKPLSMLEMQRLPFAKNRGKIKRREKDTLQKLEQFKSLLKSKEVKDDEENWMNNKLKFHIDSERAYGLQKTYSQAQQNTELGKIKSEQEKQLIGEKRGEPEITRAEQKIDIEEILEQLNDNKKSQ